MCAKVRRSAVAGTFYPGGETELMDEVRRFISDADAETCMATTVIVPHAGYLYSGGVTGAVFGSVDVPDRVIIIGPNHRGVGATAAVDGSTAWSFPFGDVMVDAELSKMLVDGCKNLEYDSFAHEMEHSLEVVVPFLFARNPHVSIAAICLETRDGQKLESIGKAVANAQNSSGALVVASSDMVHYVPDATARDIDRATIEIVERLDQSALLQKVKRDNSLCGAGAVAVALTAAKENGCKKAKLVRYATSGDVSGDLSSVVGYAGFTIN